MKVTTFEIENQDEFNEAIDHAVLDSICSALHDLIYERSKQNLMKTFVRNIDNKSRASILKDLKENVELLVFSITRAVNVTIRELEEDQETTE